VQFTREDERSVRKVIERFGGAKGERYPEAYLKWSFAESPELGSQ